MYRASLEHRNAAASPMSSAVPIAPMGTVASALALCSGVRVAAIPASMYPGAKALQVIPRLATSLAVLRVNPIIPAFAAA